jgi:hypothetical protein
VSTVSAFVRAHLAVTLTVTLTLGAVLGIAGGYALGTHQEAKQPDPCQALAQTLLDLIKQGEVGQGQAVLLSRTGDGCQAA